MKDYISNALISLNQNYDKSGNLLENEYGEKFRHFFDNFFAIEKQKNDIPEALKLALGNIPNFDGSFFKRSTKQDFIQYETELRKAVKDYLLKTFLASNEILQQSANKLNVTYDQLVSQLAIGLKFKLVSFITAKCSPKSAKHYTHIHIDNKNFDVTNKNHRKKFRHLSDTQSTAHKAFASKAHLNQPSNLKNNHTTYRFFSPAPTLAKMAYGLEVASLAMALLTAVGILNIWNPTGWAILSCTIGLGLASGIYMKPQNMSYSKRFAM